MSSAIPGSPGVEFHAFQVWVATTGGAMICLLRFVICTLIVFCAATGPAHVTTTNATIINTVVRFIFLAPFGFVVEVMSETRLHPGWSEVFTPSSRKFHISIPKQFSFPCPRADTETKLLMNRGKNIGDCNRS